MFKRRVSPPDPTAAARITLRQVLKLQPKREMELTAANEAQWAAESLITAAERAARTALAADRTASDASGLVAAEELRTAAREAQTLATPAREQLPLLTTQAQDAATAVSSVQQAVHAATVAVLVATVDDDVKWLRRMHAEYERRLIRVRGLQQLVGGSWGPAHAFHRYSNGEAHRNLRAVLAEVEVPAVSTARDPYPPAALPWVEFGKQLLSDPDAQFTQ